MSRSFPAPRFASIVARPPPGLATADAADAAMEICDGSDRSADGVGDGARWSPGPGAGGSAGSVFVDSDAADE